MRLTFIITGALLGAMSGEFPSDPASPPPRGSLTAVAGVTVGHHTLTERPTGCTAILVEQGAVAGVDVRGAAPGTRETDLLNPVNTVDKVHAIVLAGGSAFGLDAASGVVRLLEERGVGFPVGAVRVPIVPAAVLLDLGVGGDPRIRPTAECGYRAARSATAGPVAEGNVGAGAGATVGKLGGIGRAMKSGLGSAAITMPDGLIVSALAAVNAAGDVIDPATNRVVAGMRTSDGKSLADARVLVRSGALKAAGFGGNTTLVVVATNAALTKSEATLVARMSHDGLARTIWPVHSPLDGDVVFTLATGARQGPADLVTLGALAADVVAESVLRAVCAATGLPGLPSASDFGRCPSI